ncbi:MAG: inositol monophosphatase [Pseudohongiellaceae bacterium]
MHALANIALRAANDAAEALAHSSDRLDRISILNSNPDDFTTSLDENADKTIRYHIEKAFPSHSINSRFSGIKEGEDKSTVWLIDPLVGGQNLAVGYPAYGVAVACEINGIVSHAVFVTPGLREEVVASRGKGAQLNSRRIRVNAEPSLSSSLYGVSCSKDFTEQQITLQKAITEQGGSPRISGVPEIDIINAASGRLDGGWTNNRTTHAMATALLVLQEAGGLVGSESGNPTLSSAKELLYGGPNVFKHLLKIRAKS